MVSVIEDWKLIALNIIPNSYFVNGDGTPNETSLTSYSNYVKTLTRARLPDPDSTDTTIVKAKAAFSIIDTNFPVTTLAFNLTDNETQLSARAVFLDLPPDDIYESSTFDTSDVHLDRIPFYEENVTMLAGWIPDANNSSFISDYVIQHDAPADATPSTNWVTNETLIDPPVYSRGLFFANVLADPGTTVKARLKNGNPGQVNIVNFIAPPNTEPDYLHLDSENIDANSLTNNILLPSDFTPPSNYPIDSSVSSSGGDAELVINVE